MCTLSSNTGVLEPVIKYDIVKGLRTARNQRSLSVQKGQRPSEGGFPEQNLAFDLWQLTINAYGTHVHRTYLHTGKVG